MPPDETTPTGATGPGAAVPTPTGATGPEEVATTPADPAPVAPPEPEPAQAACGPAGAEAEALANAGAEERQMAGEYANYVKSPPEADSEQKPAA